MSCATGQAVVATGTLQGVNPVDVEVQVDVGRGLPSFSIVGLGDTAIHEARDRVRAAIRSSGLKFPDGRVVVNLAPAPLRKHGTGFDLPIALGVLTATGQIPHHATRDAWCVGELTLDGRVMPVHGIMAHAIAARAAGKELLCSALASSEVSAIANLSWRPVECLAELDGSKLLTSVTQRRDEPAGPSHLDTVVGHETAKRCAEIAAAGRLNLLLIGPPGSGKTLLARSIPDILPPMTHAEAVDAALVHSVAGLDASSCLNGIRPFRAPHHTATRAGLVGGGTRALPGEVSLAHNGVLFLDEMSEFGPATLQALRQPLEDGHVTLVRADGSTTLPACFMLVAASNPCACGFHGDPVKRCTCSPNALHTHAARIGGPLLDRIDLAVRMDRVDPTAMVRQTQPSPPSQARERVRIASQRAQERGHPIRELAGRSLLDCCKCDGAALAAVEQVARTGCLSGRGLTRLLRVARVIADIEGCSAVTKDHIYEARAYRVEDVVHE